MSGTALGFTDQARLRDLMDDLQFQPERAQKLCSFDWLVLSRAVKGLVISVDAAQLILDGIERWEKERQRG